MVKNSLDQALFHHDPGFPILLSSIAVEINYSVYSAEYTNSSALHFGLEIRKLQQPEK